MAPAELPEYREACLNPYKALGEIGRNEDEDPFHFAPSLIKMIAACEGQEVGTHTLSHFYALAPGPTLESFRADLKSAKSAAGKYDIALKSIVFPRNQISRPHLRICAEEGLIAYRSTEADPWVREGNGIIKRTMRLGDSYLRLNGDGCATPRLDEEFELVSVSGSRFLRPWNGAMKAFEAMRLKRICASMDAAAKRDKVFHLWWHPHNFGAHLDENMAVLTRIAEHYANLRRETGWPSRTMSEVAEFSIEAVVREARVPRSAFLKRRIEKLGWRTVLGQIMFAKCVIPPLRREGAQRRADILREYEMDESPIPGVIDIPSVNDGETVTLLRKLSPQVVLVNGTRILGETVLQATSAVFLNTHVGITPLYRGVHGGYWALASGDREHFGVTIHKIDCGIDTGAIIAQAIIQPTGADNFSTYPLLQVAAAIPLLKQAVRDALGGSLEAMPAPEGKSRLWSHPTVFQYLKGRIARGVR